MDNTTQPTSMVMVTGGGKQYIEQYGNGDSYVGMLVGGLREGKGEYEYVEGSIKQYSGDFVEGLGNGVGRFTYVAPPTSHREGDSRVGLLRDETALCSLVGTSTESHIAKPTPGSEMAESTKGGSPLAKCTGAVS
jgi:hypothetical protein